MKFFFRFFLFNLVSVSVASFAAPVPQTPKIYGIPSINQTDYEISRYNKLQGSSMCGFFAAYNAENLLNSTYALEGTLDYKHTQRFSSFNKWLAQRQAALEALSQMHSLHEGEITSLLTQTEGDFYRQHCLITELLSLRRCCFQTPQGDDLFVPYELESPLLTAIQTFRTHNTAHAVILHLESAEFNVPPHWIVVFLPPDETVLVMDSLNLLQQPSPSAAFIREAAAFVAYVFHHIPLPTPEELPHIHQDYWRDVLPPREEEPRAPTHLAPQPPQTLPATEAAARAKSYKTSEEQRTLSYMEMGGCEKDALFLLQRAANKALSKKERAAIKEALATPFKAKAQHWQEAEILKSFSCHAQLRSCTGNALQRMLHHNMVALALDSGKTYKKYVLDPLAINKIIHVESLHTLLDSFLSLACSSNKALRPLRTYKLIELCEAIKTLQLLLGDFFKEHQTSTTNGICQVARLGLFLDPHKEFGKDITTIMHMCRVQQVNSERLNTDIANLLTTITLRMVDVLISYYADENEVMDVVVNHCPHILMFHTLNSNNRKQYAIPEDLRPKRDAKKRCEMPSCNFHYEVVFDLAERKLHNLRWRDILIHEEVIQEAALTHATELAVKKNIELTTLMPSELLTQPVTIIFKNAARIIRELTEDGRKKIKESEWEALKTSYLQAGNSAVLADVLVQRAQDDTAPQKERDAIIELLDNPTHTPQRQRTYRIPPAAQKHYSDYTHLTQFTGTRLQGELHRQAIRALTQEATCYGKYFVDPFDINKIWHVKNLHKLFVTLFDHLVQYNQEDDLLNTYDSLAACRSISAIDRTLGNLLNDNLRAIKNSLWSLFNSDINFDAEFGKDLLKQKASIDETFTERLNSHYTACSAALCNMIERRYSSQDAFKTAIAKYQVAKSNTNLAITALAKILMWPDDLIEEIPRILAQENRIARHAPQISHQVTKPLTFLLDRVGKELRHRGRP